MFIKPVLTFYRTVFPINLDSTAVSRYGKVKRVRVKLTLLSQVTFSYLFLSLGRKKKSGLLLS